MARRFLVVGAIGALAACEGGKQEVLNDGGGAGSSSSSSSSSSSGAGGGPGDPGPLLPPSGTTGCGLEGVTGAFHQTIEVLGRQRTFYVSVPADYDNEHEYPVIFGYHGGDDYGGQAMRDYLDLERIDPVGSEIFVYPDASAVNDPNGTGWEYGITAAAKADDAFFDAMLEIMSSNYCIDANRVFVTGQSAGGGYAAQLACHRGGVVRAAVPVAANIVLCNDVSCVGWGDTHPTLCSGTPNIMQMHSPDDWIEYLPFGLGTFELLASAAGCGAWTGAELLIADLGTLPMEDISPPTCQRRPGCNSEMVLCSYSGGHQIPGWNGPSEFEYQQVTMDFFRSH